MNAPITKKATKPVAVDRDWHWLADDGRVYSSLRSITVPPDDAAYAAWAAAGGVPVPWPVDAAGEQTEASLMPAQTVANEAARMIDSALQTKGNAK